MSRITRWLSAAIAGVALSPVAALAQFPSALVNFDGPPIDDPATSQEMFRTPQTSGTTAGFIVPNGGAFDQNSAFRAGSGFGTGGSPDMQVTFRWVNPSDPNAWLRLTTFEAPVRGNPALHLGGKVRFKIVNESEFFDGDVGICLGIRETGANVPQLADGGFAGDIEWVGVTGVRTDPNGVPQSPIPAVTIPPSPTQVMLEWNLATGVVSLNGTPQGGTIIGFTGDGVLSAPNNRGVLEHIAITNVSGDPATTIILHIDDLQFEAPVADPVLPPRIVSPMINGDTLIRLTDLGANVNQVQVLRNDALIITQNVVDPNNVLALTLPAPAVTGEVYKARQRDSVTGTTSGDSEPVTVFAEPSPYGISFAVDEDGDGSCATGWEFVGATSLTSSGGFLYPEGVALFPDNSQWQTVDIELNNPATTQAWIGGDGSLDPSPSGVYTLDALWLNVSSSAGPHEIYVDAIQLIDPNGSVRQTIHDFEDGIEYMTRIRGQSNTNFTTSGLSSTTAYDGVSSHRVTWSYADTDQKALGLLTRVGFQCATSPEFPDSGGTIRVHYLALKQTDPNLPAAPAVSGPIVGDQDSVRVLCDPTATVQLYVNGVATGAPMAASGASQVDFTGLTLQVGDSVSATQNIGGTDSDFALPQVVNALPPAPTLEGPIFPGQTSAVVSGLSQAPFATSEFAQIYINGAFAGSAATGGADAVEVSILIGGPFAEGDAVTATQFYNNAESLFSAEVIVGVPGPTIHSAPAAGAASVRVIDVDPNASLVEVFVSDGGAFSANPNGATAVDVPVSGLDPNETVFAQFTLNGVDSGPSALEVVTVAATTPVLCDDFEYDEATYLATWADSAAPRPTLSTDRNTTTGGTTSLLGDVAGHRVQRTLSTTIVPTPSQPLVFNVNVYDGVGPGVTGDNWAQIIDTTSDFFLLHIGMSSFFLANPDLNYYQARINGNGGPDWFNLDEFEAPQRSIGWHVFTMVHKGDFMDIYVDGLLAKKNLPFTAPTTFGAGTALARIGPGFNAPSANGSYDDYCLETGAIRFNEIGDQPPGAPSVAAPLEDGDTVVTVDGIDPDVTLVRVLDAGLNVLGTAAGADPNSNSATITLNRALVALERITADATNANGTATSTPLEVGQGNGRVFVSLGIRETGDAGPLGSEGGTTGSIEWIGASTTSGGAPIGVALSPAAGWQTVTFDPGTDPITGFTGDGVINGTRGTLEHLAVSVDPNSGARSAGLYQIYVDNVVNVGAGGGGSDFVIEDFESNLDGEEVLFQEPTFSGTTAGNLTPLPSFSGVSVAQGNPGQSGQLNWFFRDTDAGRWVRITTSGTAFRSRPVIDLTRPVRMDILILPAGASGCPGDVDGNGSTAIDDLLIILGNFGDPGPGSPGDADGDGDTDLDDLLILLGNFGCMP